MTYQELFDLLEHITYKKNSHISIQPAPEGEKYVARICISQQLPNVNFPAVHPTTIGLAKKLTANELNKLTPRTFMGHLRGWWGEFELHERDEWLKLKGETVVDPHPETTMDRVRRTDRRWAGRMWQRWKDTA